MWKKQGKRLNVARRATLMASAASWKAERCIAWGQCKVDSGRKWSWPSFVKQERAAISHRLCGSKYKHSLKGHYSYETHSKGWWEDLSSRLLLLGKRRRTAAEPSETSNGWLIGFKETCPSRDSALNMGMLCCDRVELGKISWCSFPSKCVPSLRSSLGFKPASPILTGGGQCLMPSLSPLCPSSPARANTWLLPGGVPGNLAPLGRRVLINTNNIAGKCWKTDPFYGHWLGFHRTWQRRGCEWTCLFAKGQKNKEQSLLEKVLKMQEGWIS